MYIHAYTCQHVFVALTNDLNTCFGANKRPQHTFLEPRGQSQALPSAPGESQGDPNAFPRGPKQLPRHPKGPKGILQQKQAN